MARLDRDTRLRYQAAIQYSVGKILEASANELAQDACGNPLPPTKFSREVMSAAGLLVFKKIPILAVDLEAFAKHAKRQKVITDDVLLCARRNPDLASKLESLAKTLKAEKQETLKKSLTTSTTAKRTAEDVQQQGQPNDVLVINLDDIE